MRKKIIFLCGLGLLLAGMAIGCGGGQSGADTTSTPPPVGSENAAALGDTGDGDTISEDETSSNAEEENADINAENQEDVEATDQKSSDADQKSDARSASGISQDEAIKIALIRVKGAKTSDVRIHKEWDDGREIYEGTIIYNQIEYDFEIDASNGTILDWEEESVYDD